MTESSVLGARAGRAVARVWGLVTLPARYHFWGSCAIVLFICAVMSDRIWDRSSFAAAKLHGDVMDRWGAPIVQPAPSVRWVASGTVFNGLHKLAPERQSVEVDSTMSYRKRGLVYFSGFEFGFRGSYRVRNPEASDIDVVFVFPIDLERNRVLLSNLEFAVGGRPERIDPAASADKLVWTGRLAGGAEVDLDISYRGRGLDSFTYKLDPSLPAKNFDLTMRVSGGKNFDYAEGVVAARAAELTDDGFVLRWQYDSLESGVPVGMIVPSTRSFDQIIGTMVARAWAPWVLLFVGLVGVVIHFGRPLLTHEAYLVAAAYGLFFTLLAYLAAYMHFYAAYAISLAAISAMIVGYLSKTVGPAAARPTTALVAAFLAVPTLAVILEQHTGLIYSLEILAGLATLMALTTRPWFRLLLERLVAPVEPLPSAVAGTGGGR